MRKSLFIPCIAAATVAMLLLPAAALPDENPLPKGQAFGAIWEMFVGLANRLAAVEEAVEEAGKAIDAGDAALQAQLNDLQEQLEAIQSIPGEEGAATTGACTCDITRAELDDLYARLDALENLHECAPGSTVV